MKQYLTTIITQLESELKRIPKDEMDEASWAYEKGIIITGNTAKRILTALAQKEKTA